MPWVKYGDGLKIIGEPHYDKDEVKRLINILGQNRRGHPETVCRQLNEFLNTGIIIKDLIWRLSKWCDWDDQSMDIAIKIAKELFFGIVCRRLRNQQNRPTPDSVTANQDYEKWIEAVISNSNNNAQETVYPDEIDGENYIEGAKHSVTVNAYERNKNARQKCIEHYGAKCVICGFDFSEFYQGIGNGFIHVHHIKPLSEINSEYNVDPINDLRPACPNCHAVIHRFKKPYSIEEVKKMVKK